MTALQASALHVSAAEFGALLDTAPDLRDPATLRHALTILDARRGCDLCDLPPNEQAALIGGRAVTVLPGPDRLAELLGSGRRLTVKFGIDPTAADVHLGHAVPMILANRFQRMGHHVVVIVGDVTARIGDPTGRTADRPALTDADVAANLATYREQVAPFVDLETADFRHNREWLGGVTLPEFLATLERLPASAALQRDDFRERIAAGAGLSLAELIYAVVMALDSVHTHADVELGGLDQLLNMQMGRRVMEAHDLVPQAVVAAPLIEGTDGTGAKMSKSKGNYVAFGATATDLFGGLMAVPDRIVPSFLAALTELLDDEIARLSAMHPMAVKTLLAAVVTATVGGRDAALDAHAGFVAQFSRRRFAEMPGVTRVALGTQSAIELFAGLVGSARQVRRIADGGGLRLIADGGEQVALKLTGADADLPLRQLRDRLPAGGRTFAVCGRRVIELI